MKKRDSKIYYVHNNFPYNFFPRTGANIIPITVYRVHVEKIHLHFF